MMMFLVLKERLKSFYGKYTTAANGIVKFVFSFTAIVLMGNNIGFMTKLTGPVAAVFLSLTCAFLPYGAISFLLGIVMLVHIYTVSMETALITAVFLIIVALLYYGFQPGDSFWLVLTPMAFFLKVPFVIPLLAGLSGGLTVAIPLCCGVAVYYILQYVKQNAGVLTNDASVDITQKFVQIIRAIVTNRAMAVMIVAFVVGILVVYLLRTQALDYSWSVASIVGVVAQLAVVFAGDYLFDVSMPILELLTGALFSLLIAAAYQFFVFAVDYTRTEYTQFEDDDYVYYVKAVPKVSVSRPDVRVQHINNPARGRRGR